MMRGLKKLLTLLLVIVLAIISFSVLCFASAFSQADGAEKNAAGSKSFSITYPLAMPTPPVNNHIRASKQYLQQRDLSVWRLVVLLMASFIVTSRQRLLYRYSSNRLKNEFTSIFMASYHIFRAPPILT